MTTSWPLIREEEVDSTSRLARELLDQGKAAPFAIVARRQTAGRGRRGTQWESPEGGLYLTIACPKVQAAGSQAGTIPLKAGLLIARFLKHRLGFTPTLKWPNDLVFAGRKLGGILCEVAVTGADRGPVLVGIGINVKTTPMIEGDYPAISLRDVTGASLDPLELAGELVDAFAEGWEALSLSEVPRAFESESLAGPGHLLLSRGTGQIVTFRRIDDDGSLVATPLEGGAEIRLASIEHDYAWIYLGKHRDGHPVAVADVGNSAVKLAVFSPASAPEPRVVRVLAKSELTPEALREFRQAAKLPSGWPVFALAVDRVAAGQLGLAMDRAGLVLKPLSKTPLLRKGERYSLADLGADRLAAIEGWLARRPGEGLAVLVSAGTATTIDAVTEDGVHWGGLILPGLQTGLNALASHTDLLPTLDAREVAMPSGGIGSDTRSAMGQGVRMMTLGAVKAFANAVAALAGRPLEGIHYVVTGGFAPLIARELEAKLCPTLILEGIRAMALGGVTP